MKGANKKTQNLNGIVLFLFAAANVGHHEIVKILLDNGAEIEITDYQFHDVTSFVSSDNGHREIVKILLDNGAEIEAKNKKGMTPLLSAAKKWS